MQCRPISFEVSSGIVHHPAPGITPIPRDAGQASDGAYGHTSTSMPLKPLPEFDRSWPRLRYLVSEQTDRLPLDSGYLSASLDGVRCRSRTQLLESERMLPDELIVLPVLFDDEVHQSHGQRRISTRLDLQM